MIETVYHYERTENFVMAKVVDDEHVNINHIVVQPGGAVPVHVANSNVYQIVVRGTLSLSLEDGEPHLYTVGDIISVPFNTKMAIRNGGADTLEFFVVKTPNPRDMPATKKV